MIRKPGNPWTALQTTRKQVRFSPLLFKQPGALRSHLREIKIKLNPQQQQEKPR